MRTLAEIGHLIPTKWLTFDGNLRYSAKGSNTFLRHAWFREIGDKCQYCGAKMNHPSGKHGRPLGDWTATVEHITPRALGGTDELGNLTFVCLRCNQREARKTYREVAAA